MEFDEVVDNMIVRKKGTQYIMILQCNGVNYDLMSEDEKISCILNPLALKRCFNSE